MCVARVNSPWATGNITGLLDCAMHETGSDCVCCLAHLHVLQPNLLPILHHEHNIDQPKASLMCAWFKKGDNLK